MPAALGQLLRRPLVWAPATAIVLAIVIAALVFGSDSGSGSRASGSPARRIESIFQDDQLLLNSSTPVVTQTLRRLRGLGVDRVRVTVLWLAIAPEATSPTQPAGFRPADPRSYPPSGWAAYDRLVELAHGAGIAVDFNLTAPGPLWAMARPAPVAKLATHYKPSAQAFGQFVTAVGRRYSGSFRGLPGRGQPLPRVGYWTIWNEPNQPGWLAPQWRPAGATSVPASPRFYRQFVDRGFAALKRTGHGPSTDTVLIGELAPEGTETTTAEAPIPPLVFLRAMYCVDSSDRPLRGAQARPLHCPASGAPAAFVAAHPGLFDATGFAHHPYAFFLAPDASMSDPNFVPLSDLGRLEGALDRIFAAYGVHRQLPIYLTEYGYETNPPNPFRGMSLTNQARYLNQAQYIADRDPRVRALAQFLLVDSAPNRAFPKGSIGFWSTFQTGLEFLGGKPKPSLSAYRLPIVVPAPEFARGRPTLVWAMLRAAANDTVQHARIQWRPPRGRFRTVAPVTTADPDGVFRDRVTLPGSGFVRVAWTAPSGKVFHSRRVAVTDR